MKCIKCDSGNLYVIAAGPHNKLVCVDCLTFQKFISTPELKILRRSQTILRIRKPRKPRKPRIRKPSQKILTREDIIDLIREELKRIGYSDTNKIKEKDIPY